MASIFHIQDLTYYSANNTQPGHHRLSTISYSVYLKQTSHTPCLAVSLLWTWG
jgi:hypothetical protein